VPSKALRDDKWAEVNLTSRRIFSDDTGLHAMADEEKSCSVRTGAWQFSQIATRHVPLYTSISREQSKQNNEATHFFCPPTQQ
jgi:hypothetical protein